VPGFIGAGKTGTAERKGEGKGYARDKFVLSFVGMLPADNPQFVCLVMLDSPTVKTREENFGGAVAAPIFARIAGKAACHLNMAPQFEAPPLQVALSQPKTP
jgi:cell division protein FtsI/penicillin-binding protein 2